MGVALCMGVKLYVSLLKSIALLSVEKSDAGLFRTIEKMLHSYFAPHYRFDLECYNMLTPLILPKTTIFISSSIYSHSKINDFLSISIF